MKELMYENLPARREIVTINKVYNQTFYKLIDFRYEMWNVNYNRMYQQRSQSSILHYLMKEKNNTLKPKCLSNYFDTHIMEPLVLRFMIIFSIFSLNLKRNEFDFL